MIIALIPAAGKSTRMGRPKLALPLGERTVVEHVITAFHGAGVGHVLVVAGPHVPEVAQLARRAGAMVHELSHETADMRATVEEGLAWVEQHHAMRDDDLWFLAPADHPCLEAAVIQELLAEQKRYPEASIFIPEHEGRRGHPALLAWRHVSGIRALPAGVGLNAYFRMQQPRLVPVASSGILVDLDTPEDYANLLPGLEDSTGATVRGP
jgi:molybdenum cofactor cytidylyltransferase